MVHLDSFFLSLLVFLVSHPTTALSPTLNNVSFAETDPTQGYQVSILTFVKKLHSVLLVALKYNNLLRHYAKQAFKYREGNNKVSAQLEKFFRWNPSGTFRNIPWYH